MFKSSLTRSPNTILGGYARHSFKTKHQKHGTLYPCAALDVPFSFNDICQVARHDAATLADTQFISVTAFSVYWVSEMNFIQRRIVSCFRLLQRDKNNLEALRMLALHSLCRTGDVTEVTCFLLPYKWITEIWVYFFSSLYIIKEVFHLFKKKIISFYFVDSDQPQNRTFRSGKQQKKWWSHAGLKQNGL